MNLSNFPAIPLENFKTYLLVCGWKILGQSKNLIHLCLNFDRKKYQIYLPAYESFCDYNTRIDEALQTLSHLHKEHPERIKHIIDNFYFFKTEDLKGIDQIRAIIDKNKSVNLDFLTRLIEYREKLLNFPQPVFNLKLTKFPKFHYRVCKLTQGQIFLADLLYAPLKDIPVNHKGECWDINGDLLVLDLLGTTKAWVDFSKQLKNI